jgi:branched-chain amino acid transport system substrate-binding protein
MVAFLLFVNDVHGMGLKVAQGLQLLEAFYWDMDDDTRAFAKRFAARPGMNGKMPSGNQAGVYASTLAYLNAVAATGSDDAKDAVPQMKKFKGKDKLFGDVTIRQDGRVIHPMYLFEVKKPEESKYPYDYYKLVSTIPADQAFRPIADGGCSLVKCPERRLKAFSKSIVMAGTDARVKPGHESRVHVKFNAPPCCCPA